MMEWILKEIESLIEYLEKAHPEAESTEGIAIEYLKCLLRKPGNLSYPENPTSEFSEFKRFWLESVPWCSDLSRQIEKLIILYDESQNQETR